MIPPFRSYTEYKDKENKITTRFLTTIWKITWKMVIKSQEKVDKKCENQKKIQMENHIKK